MKSWLVQTCLYTIIILVGHYKVADTPFQIHGDEYIFTHAEHENNHIAMVLHNVPCSTKVELTRFECTTYNIYQCYYYHLQDMITVIIITMIIKNKQIHFG